MPLCFSSERLGLDIDASKPIRGGIGLLLQRKFREHGGGRMICLRQQTVAQILDGNDHALLSQPTFFADEFQ